MDTSVFMDKSIMPDDEKVMEKLPAHFHIWLKIKKYIINNYPSVIEEWTHTGKKYGWSFRMKSKKRTVMYFLPRDNYFKAAFVFGQKAADIALSSDIPDAVKESVKSATVYAEGRGFRFDIKDEVSFDTVIKLIKIKMEN